MNNYLKDLKAAWNWGIDFLDLPELNPFARIPKYAVNSNPRYVPPLSDFWKVYDKARSQDKNLLLAFFHTAGRRGDLFRLRWEDVDFSRGTVNLRSRKNKTATWVTRTIVISSSLRDALLSQQGSTSAKGFVFISESTNAPWKTREKIMRELCGKAYSTGLPIYLKVKKVK